MCAKQPFQQTKNEKCNSVLANKINSCSAMCVCLSARIALLHSSSRLRAETPHPAVVTNWSRRRDRDNWQNIGERDRHKRHWSNRSNRSNTSNRRCGRDHRCHCSGCGRSRRFTVLICLGVLRGLGEAQRLWCVQFRPLKRLRFARLLPRGAFRTGDVCLP